MADTPEQRWFAIRTVYLFGQKRDGKNVFEERTVVFSGADQEQAFRKGAVEAQAYAEANGVVGHPEQVAYEQDGEPLIDGYEVWSQLYESGENLDSFHASRYGRYEYHPDERESRRRHS